MDKPFLSFHPRSLQSRAFRNKTSSRIGSRLVGALVAMVLLWCELSWRLGLMSFYCAGGLVYSPPAWIASPSNSELEA
jgi:hypothetical protein